MFADTITITINSIAKALTRINQDGYSSEYFLRESTGEFRLRIRNSKYVDKTRAVPVDRHNVELIHMVYPATAGDPPLMRKMYTVIENDQGDDIVHSAKFSVGLVGFHTEANITKMLNWES